jgi:hypothetical protein
VFGLGAIVACGGAESGPAAGYYGNMPNVGGTLGASGGQAMSGGPGVVATAGSGGNATAGTSSVSPGGSSSGGMSAGGTAGVDNAGGQGMGGNDGMDPMDDPFGPRDCLPEFETVCGPTINFENEDPGNSGNFDAVISDVEETMQWAACTVCSIMYRTADEVPRTHDTINFIIDNHDGVAYAGGNSIHLSTNHIQNYGNPDSALVEFRGVMIHETAHLYQENGGSSDGALIEGVADFVRIRVGLYGLGRRGGGGNWDGAYTTSGFFFSWLAGPCEYHDDNHPMNDIDIGSRINQVMSQGKGAIQAEIESTFGTDINTLWNQYQDAI